MPIAKQLVCLNSLSFELARSGLLLSTWSATPFLDAFGFQLAPNRPCRVENQLIEFRDYMEYAQLMFGIRPNLLECQRIQVRTIRNDCMRRKPVIVEVSHEPNHVRGIILGNQSTSDRVVGDRVTGQQQYTMAQMNLINAQDATELREHVLAELVAIEFSDRMIQCRVNVTRGKFDQEVTLHTGLDCRKVQLVVENPVDDGLANSVVILGFEVDMIRMAVKRFAAVALGPVFAVVNFQPENLLIAQ